MREARKKPKEHKELDVMKPFSYFDLGTSKDPCFGKLYSIQAKECKRCGDCETCAIVTSQKGFLKQIEEQNSKGDFLDTQEGDLITKQNGKIKTLMEKKVKGNKDKLYSITKLAEKMIEKFNLNEHDLEYMKQRVIKAAQDSSIIILDKPLKKYKYGKDK